MASWEEEFADIVNPEKRAELSSKIADESRVGLSTIVSQMQRQTELYNKWSYFQFLIEGTESKAEARYKEALADAKNRIRSSSGKISVDACSDRATVDPIVKRCLASYNDAKAYHTLIKQVVKGMAQKRDMLMSINSRQKKEMESVR